MFEKKHPELKAVIEHVEQQVKAGNFGLQNPCQYCGQKYQLRRQHLSSCAGIFNGHYFRHRLHLGTKEHGNHWTAELSTLASLLPQGTTAAAGANPLPMEANADREERRKNARTSGQNPNTKGRAAKGEEQQDHAILPKNGSSSSSTAIAGTGKRRTRRSSGQGWVSGEGNLQAMT